MGLAMAMLIWFTLCILSSPRGDYTVEVEYENPGPVFDEYVTDPYCFTISPQGETFIVDRMSSRIHVWGQNGKYRRSFGKKSS